MEPFDVVRGFERKLSEYTSAPYVVAVNSCSMALFLAFLRYKRQGGLSVRIPAKTYPSVPMGAHNAGLNIEWVHGSWQGPYWIPPSAVVDCALRFTSGMYNPGEVQCISFHVQKHLKLGQGGALLHDDAEADAWYRKMRFDGRTEGVPTKDDTYREAGYHAYMSPDVAARGLWLLSVHPKRNEDLPKPDYPDMSKWSWTHAD